MVAMRQRRLRYLGAIALAALLIVPVLSSGHWHAAHAATAPCAACVATQHTPVVSAPAMTTPTCVAIVTGVEAVPVQLPAGPVVGRAVSRGPPAVPVTQGA